MDQTRVKLRIDGIHKAYGSVVALEPTSLDVQEGEFVTLLGPSGSGKTTMLHSVAGLTEPDGGRIWIDGHDVTRQAPFKRDLGMVFQNYALFPHLNVFENIAFPLRMRRCPSREIETRVREALELVQLAHAARRLPRELSGGQQQRVALARCVVYKPSIVLMDEPLGALDKKLREQMQAEIRRIHRELGTTMLYVTHDQEEAMTLSDRIILMRNGRIEQSGSPHSLYIEPNSTYAADFLGDSNLLPATLVSPSDVALSAGGAAARVRCVARPDLQAGQPVRCFVRPEVIRLLPQGEAADNEFEGTIEEVILAGGVTRYSVTLTTGIVLRANELTSTDSSSRSLGEKVRIGFSARDARILTGEASAG